MMVTPALAKPNDTCVYTETVYEVKELPWVTVMQDTPSEMADELGWCKAPKPDLENIPRGGILIWYEYAEDGTCNPNAYVGR